MIARFNSFHDGNGLGSRIGTYVGTYASQVKSS
jgi:hypothetical protein